MKKILRVTTVPVSLSGLLKGQLNYMNQYFELVGVSSQDGRNLNYVEEQENIRVIAVPMTRKITPLKDLKALFMLYKVIKREKPDIVHSHTPKAGTIAMLAAKLAGIPHRLHTIAGLPLLESKGFKRILLNTVERITYGNATKIYPNSYGLKSIVIEQGFTSPDKLKVLGNGSSNGINTKDFDPTRYDEQTKSELRKRLDLEKDFFVFVYVGRFVSDKGINELVKAFLELNKKYSDIRLLMVGSYEKDLDPLHPDTEYLLETHPSIINVGWQKDVKPFFAISDVLTFPSYREGFPNVVMQAGAMGLYSIVSDINGCNEIIVNGENGVVIPPKDYSALKEAMEDSLLNREKIPKKSGLYREMIQKRYEQQYVWSEIKKEYDNLLA